MSTDKFLARSLSLVRSTPPDPATDGADGRAERLEALVDELAADHQRMIAVLDRAIARLAPHAGSDHLASLLDDAIDRVTGAPAPTDATPEPAPAAPSARSTAPGVAGPAPATREVPVDEAVVDPLAPPAFPPQPATIPAVPVAPDAPGTDVATPAAAEAAAPAAAPGAADEGEAPAGPPTDRPATTEQPAAPQASAQPQAPAGEVVALPGATADTAPAAGVKRPVWQANLAAAAIAAVVLVLAILFVNVV